MTTEASTTNVAADQRPGTGRAVLDQQHARLSALEREILTWLAIEREPAGIPALCENLVGPSSPRELVEALLALQRRSLLEQIDGRFTLQNVLREYLTDLVAHTANRDVDDG